MSRWDAASSDDYDDEPWARAERCETPTCEHTLSPVSASVYCEECRKMQRRRAVLQDAAFAEKEKAS